MRQLNDILPAGKSWRELWLAQNIAGTHWPSSVPGGQPITLTNEAAKRTTADGIHFVAGVDTSNVKFADPYDAVNDLYASIFFTPDQTFSSASSADMYLVSKFVDATNYWFIFLRASDGKLVMEHREGNGAETIVSAETSWAAGTRVHVLGSCNTGVGQRLIIDGGTAVTEAGNQTAISLIADVTIGARDDGTSTEGFGGVIHGSVVMGGGADVELTTTANTGEEALLAKGIPPATAKVINLFTFDKGRDVTANDRGSGADDATLDSSCSWSYGVRQATMSVDGINDYGVSSSGVDISGDLSVVLVTKEKAVLDANVPAGNLLYLFIDGSNRYFFQHPVSVAGINFAGNGGSGLLVANDPATPAIDTRRILIGTSTSGLLELFSDGVSKATAASIGNPSGSPATVYISSNNTLAGFGISSSVLVGLIDGALSGQEALNLSRYINNWMGLGLTI